MTRYYPESLEPTVQKLRIMYENEIIPKHEVYKRFPKVKQLYQKYPLLWYELHWGGDVRGLIWDRFEGYEEHEWDGDPNPLFNAWMEVSKFEWVGIESATGTGKTYLAALLIFWFLDLYPDALVVVSGISHGRLKETVFKEVKKQFAKFKIIQPLAVLTKEPKLILEVPKYDEKGTEVGLDYRAAITNTPQIKKTESEAGAQAQGGAGSHSGKMLIICDEASGLAPSLITSYTSTTGGDTNALILLGNPKQSNDPLHIFCTDPAVKAFRVSALDGPNHVTGEEKIPGATGTRQIQRMMVSKGVDSPVFLRLMRGISPELIDETLFKSFHLKACYKRKTVNPPEQYPIEFSMPARGIDVANSAEGDKAADAIINEEGRLVYLKDFKCEDSNAIAWNIVVPKSERKRHFASLGDKIDREYGIPSIVDGNPYMLEPENIGVDVVGLGVSTKNAFLHLKYNQIFGYNSQFKANPKLTPVDEDIDFQNLRSQIIWIADQMIQRGQISFDIPKDMYDRLKVELSAHQISKRNSKKFQILPKESVKAKLRGSPNLADAFFIALYMWLTVDVERGGGSSPERRYVGVHI